ncbi:hypothetical protein [Alteribacillus bidgolensis]|uniref:Uncharacterized protein n=1 Tax=Alteribacillus bidgolensis TaxID=930129 RepID=A0A1G8IJK2_9BACI|nr:hypothetical protein [Alteribacillus bidgolensis]SDI19159.1 hypothetical protein SAMN05216352_105226 [Alteribacillus bidgolensis]
MIHQFMQDIGQLIKDLEKEGQSSVSRMYEETTKDNKPVRRYEYHFTSKTLKNDDPNSK